MANTDEKPLVYRFRYITSDETLLAIPLSDGRTSFFKGVTYKTESYADVSRLIQSGDFELIPDPDAPPDKDAERAEAVEKKAEEKIEAKADDHKHEAHKAKAKD